MIKFLIFLLMLVKIGMINAEEYIHVVTEDWKPYNYEEDGVVKGSSTEIVQQVLDRAELDYRIGVYP